MTKEGDEILPTESDLLNSISNSTIASSSSSSSSSFTSTFSESSTFEDVTFPNQDFNTTQKNEGYQSYVLGMASSVYNYFFGEDGTEDNNREGSSWSNYFLGNRQESKSDEVDERLIKFRGLMNLGNTCYFNSTIQCLNTISYLTDYFQSNLCFFLSFSLSLSFFLKFKLKL